jgi:hypothetical protein
MTAGIGASPTANALDARATAAASRATLIRFPPVMGPDFPSSALPELSEKCPRPLQAISTMDDNRLRTALPDLRSSPVFTYKRRWSK